MKFGFGFISCQNNPVDPRTDVELYADAVSLAEEAERLGFDSVWVSEHHFVDDGYMPSLLPVAAAMAARTSRIAIGTGLLLSPLHHPLRLAEDAATVDLLSRGRLILGLGQGWREEEFEAMGVPLKGRHLLFEDGIEVLKQAFRGDAVIGAGQLSYPGPKLNPLPMTPGGPPVWIGALAEPAIRRAARLSQGFMAFQVSSEVFAEQVAWARKELQSTERESEPFTWSVGIPVFAWSHGDPWPLVRDTFGYMEWKYDDMADARGKGPPPAPMPTPAAEREQELRNRLIMGTPERVAESILPYAEVVDGDLHFIARLYHPGMDAGTQREAMRIFCEEVVPLVRDALDH